MREYLFEYKWRSATWAITVFAEGPEEARMKIRAAGLAEFKGEVAAKVKVMPNWLRRLFK